MAEMARSLMDYAAPPVAQRGVMGSPAQPMSLMDYLSDLDLLNILNGTGIPERLSLVNETLNPLAAIPRAQAASQEIFAPDRSIMQRIASTGDMLSEVGGVVVPMAASTRVGVPAATALVEGLLGGSPTTQAASDAARRFLANESGAVPLPFSSSLPPARNEAEAIAKEILELRATGNVDAVTEQMMDAADPQYMYAYTPLAMDEASRMARAADIAFGPADMYHGTNNDIQGFSGATYTSDSPTLASTYARSISSPDAQIYPLRLRSKFDTTQVDGGGRLWSKLPTENIQDPAVAAWLDPTEMQSTRSIEDAARREGRSGVQFNDILDIGPSFNSQQFKRAGYSPEEAEAMRLEYLRQLDTPAKVDVRLYPNQIRSKFARFDPMFAHLRNLSAGVAPFGLLALQPNEEQY